MTIKNRGEGAVAKAEAEDTAHTTSITYNT